MTAPMKGSTSISTPSDSARMVRAACPTCACQTAFVFAGVQTWSEAVARATGQPTRVRLYTCACCGGTFSEQSLNAWCAA